MRILGIDPGLRGGLALIEVWPHETLVHFAVDVPLFGSGHVDAKHVYDEISGWRVDCAWIERAQAFPGQGASSGFEYGRAVGALEACVHAAGVPLALADPRTWKKHFNLPGKTKAPDYKEQARMAALALFPDAERWLRRKMDHGRAEALLIAAFGADELGRARAA